MFQFPWLSLTTLCVQVAVTRHDPCQVFPFGHPRILACLAAPRGLSQPATSFIGFQRLDIHRVPFATCRDDARARYEVLKVRAGTWFVRLPTLVLTRRQFGSPWSVRDSARPRRDDEAGDSHLQRCVPQPSKLHSVSDSDRCPARLVITATMCGPPNTGTGRQKID